MRALPFLALLPLILFRTEAQNLVAIEGGTLIDGTGRPPVQNAVVVIRDRTIVAAGALDEVPVDDDARIVDASGQFIMPGLIDCHIHYDSPRDLVQLLAWGVTSANCMFESTGKSRVVERRTDPDAVHSPRIYGTAPIFTTEHGWWWGDAFPVDSAINRFPKAVDEAKEMVHRAKGMGMRRIKLMYDDMDWCRDPLPRLEQMNPEIMIALISEARASGLISEVHAPKLIDAMAVVDAGASALAHGILDVPLDSVSGGKIRDGGLYYMPTFCVFEFLADVEGFMRNALGDERFRSALPAEVIRRYSGSDYYDHYRATYPNVSFVQAQLPVLRANMKLLADEHAKVVLGTDMWAFPGIGAHLELDYMVRAGMTPAQAIVSSTSLAARFLGEDGSKGTIEPGKQADLLILDGDPLMDILNTRTIRQVIKRGIVFDHDALVEESKR